MKVNLFKFIKLIFKLRGLFILFIFVFAFLYLYLLNNKNKQISVLSNLANKRIQNEPEYYIRKSTNETGTTNTIKINSELFKCKNYYDNLMLNVTIKDNYTNASEKLLKIRIVRGLVLYFPVDKSEWYEQEFRWLYRSWIEMQKYEPELWRTDLILMMDVESSIKSNSTQFFNQLNCKTSNLRRYNRDEPMCTILNYKPIKKRIFNFNNTLNITKMEPISLYSHLFHDIDVFNATDSGSFILS